MSQKSRDGNVAFKVTYNDKKWRGICSPELHEKNAINNKNQTWCEDQKYSCQSYKDEDLSINHFPCYDSIALKELSFGPCGAHKKCKYLEKDDFALLTSCKPEHSGHRRFIFAILLIDQIKKLESNSLMYMGNKDKSIILDPKQYLRFWDYHQNPNSPKDIWRSGSFRYVTDRTIVHILQDIKESIEFNEEQRIKADKLLHIISP